MATSNFKIDVYEMFRVDHMKSVKKTGGGCALYVRANVTLKKSRTNT